jgi:hypothetical protein
MGKSISRKQTLNFSLWVGRCANSSRNHQIIKFSVFHNLNLSEINRMTVGLKGDLSAGDVVVCSVD